MVTTTKVGEIEVRLDEGVEMTPQLHDFILQRFGPKWTEYMALDNRFPYGASDIWIEDRLIAIEIIRAGDNGHLSVGKACIGSGSYTHEISCPTCKGFVRLQPRESSGYYWVPMHIAR